MNQAGGLQVRCHASLGPLTLDVEASLLSPWTVLFGASGSGKSSLLALVAGLWRPTRTMVCLEGADVTRMPPYLRRIGLVAQQPALFPHLNVLENARFGCTDRSYDHADDLLDMLHLQPFRRAAVQQLSGGERQRVALARALAAQPKFLLLDEVFTGMHHQQRDELILRLREYCAGISLPVLSVTHDPVEACLAAGEVVRLEAGRITDQGPAQTVLLAERSALLQHIRPNVADRPSGAV